MSIMWTSLALMFTEVIMEEDKYFLMLAWQSDEPLKGSGNVKNNKEYCDCNDCLSVFIDDDELRTMNIIAKTKCAIFQNEMCNFFEFSLQQF